MDTWETLRSWRYSTTVTHHQLFHANRLIWTETVLSFLTYALCFSILLNINVNVTKNNLKHWSLLAQNPNDDTQTLTNFFSIFFWFDLQNCPFTVSHQLKITDYNHLIFIILYYNPSYLHHCILHLHYYILYFHVALSHHYRLQPHKSPCSVALSLRKWLRLTISPQCLTVSHHYGLQQTLYQCSL